ncbi:MAG: transglutaminase-like domain-containing protein [Opitutales bacterium]|nr:transglutaminase-like domain-containing protein [Opitutales bacterium]
MKKIWQTIVFLFFAGTALWALPTEEKCLEWLEKHVPAKVSKEYLEENVRWALAGTRDRAWARDLPDAIFLEYVLPYISVGETADPWREGFVKMLLPRVADCETATQVAERLNNELWDLVDVHYSPLRDKPDQSPFHSMRIRKASCTGLSILLIDACRAVGVPARLVSCVWPHKPGNHSWVEIYDGGNWLYLGAGDGGKVNDAWFNADTAMCENVPPAHHIYALTWGERSLKIPLYWRENYCVPADDVTARYLTLNKSKLPLCVSVIDRSGRRVATEIRVYDAAGTPLAGTLTTFDDRHDLNDHLKIEGVPATAKIRVEAADGRKLVPVPSRHRGLLLFSIEE